MPRFLLASQTFVDFARSAGSPARAWLSRVRAERGVSDIDLAVSVMSLVTLERDFQDLERAGQLTGHQLALRMRCETLAQELRHRGSVLPFEDAALPIWSQVQRLVPDLDEDAYVFASAIAQRLTLLAAPDALHDKLRPLGLLVEDPSAT